MHLINAFVLTCNRNYLIVLYSPLYSLFCIVTNSDFNCNVKHNKYFQCKLFERFLRKTMCQNFETLNKMFFTLNTFSMYI